MEVGIVGLPASGKTTLFSTLTGQDLSQDFGSGKISVHRGVVKVPDDRLDKLTDIHNPKKRVPATIEYIEVGGMDSDSANKGFDAQFLQVLKNTAALCVVVRGFENEMYPHPAGSIDINRDIQTVESEFLLSDLTIMENRIDRLEKQAMKAKDEVGLRELALLRKCHDWLETEKPLREMPLAKEEELTIRGFQFLSLKPILLVVNISEEDIPNSQAVLDSIQERQHVKAVTICASVEQEISQLDEAERTEFLADMGIAEPALNKLIRTSFELLGLISFFTVGEDECRAWTIRAETHAPQAAGAIHTDFERGFIRAEVVHYDNFINAGTMAACRDNGTLRLEGKNYIVVDGDIITFRFNV